MITLLDMLRIVATLGLAATGFALVIGHGAGWALLAAVVGGYLGFRLGNLPIRYTIRRERKKLAALSVDDLRLELQNIQARPPGWKLRFTPNYLLMELRSRGKDVSCHTELVLNLLEAEGQFSRALGYGALLSAYPHLAKNLHGYSPTKPTEDCRDRMAKLRKMMAEPSAGGNAAPPRASA